MSGIGCATRYPSGCWWPLLIGSAVHTPIFMSSELRESQISVAHSSHTVPAGIGAPSQNIYFVVRVPSCLSFRSPCRRDAHRGGIGVHGTGCFMAFSPLCGFSPPSPREPIPRSQGDGRTRRPAAPVTRSAQPRRCVWGHRVPTAFPRSPARAATTRRAGRRSCA